MPEEVKDSSGHEPLELKVQQGSILLDVGKINRIIRALGTGKKSLAEIASATGLDTDNTAFYVMSLPFLKRTGLEVVMPPTATDAGRAVMMYELDRQALERYETLLKAAHNDIAPYCTA